jgi:Uma2 family endonuclease
VGQVIDQDFVQGAPIFAAEVRSKHDYGPKAERALVAKIADYFAAGTLVVWDVDVLREKTIRVYRAENPNQPTIYGMEDEAEAEPAVPGWRVAVKRLLS